MVEAKSKKKKAAYVAARRTCSREGMYAIQYCSVTGLCLYVGQVAIDPE